MVRIENITKKKSDLHSRPSGGHRMRRYFQAYGLTGARCGHRHRSVDTAQPCRRRYLTPYVREAFS